MDFTGQTLAKWKRLEVIDVSAFAGIIFVKVMDQVGLGVQQIDPDTFGVEDIPDFIADDAGDRLDIQRLGHGFADRVEDGEFVHALR